MASSVTHLDRHLHISRPASIRRTILRRAFILAMAAACLLTTGCVRRRMTVRTFPPGAQVFVDDQEIGTTPCSASFVYYGTRKITLIKDGYKTETVWQTFNPPWHQIPPLDFFNENLNPHEIRDERIVDVHLVLQEIVPQQQLLDRAQALRDSARAGSITPLLNLPHGGKPAGSAPGGQPAIKLGLPGEGLPGGEPLPYEPLPYERLPIESQPLQGQPIERLPAVVPGQ